MVLAFGKHRICISVSVLCFLCPALESRIPLKRSQLRSSFQPLCVSTFTSPTPPWPSCHPLMSCFQSFYRPTTTTTTYLSLTPFPLITFPKIWLSPQLRFNLLWITTCALQLHNGSSNTGVSEWEESDKVFLSVGGWPRGGEVEETRTTDTVKKNEPLKRGIMIQRKCDKRN